ncbi:hypothetical protein [Winogradskyella flava]|uniref:Uncharacterized protein n=1 Tax=Winogradskyella flava TaxID=1884876 RepID=A0A842IUW6_9FLAO|nr:hypothetical protein [Winogradskyella flava]MBC2844628.1 hypothetical protein [Winogradskyella flava]
MATDLNKRKLINYRGIISFELPEDWIEEYDDNNGGAFYEDLPNSGTLRVRLISIKVPQSSNNIYATDVLNDFSSNKESKAILLTNKNAYNMFYEQVKENEIDITVYYWSLVQSIQYNKTRLANFSYTILTEELDKKHIKLEIDFLTSQIENAIFEPLYTDIS